MGDRDETGVAHHQTLGSHRSAGHLPVSDQNLECLHRHEPPAAIQCVVEELHLGHGRQVRAEDPANRKGRRGGCHHLPRLGEVQDHPVGTQAGESVFDPP